MRRKGRTLSGIFEMGMSFMPGKGWPGDPEGHSRASRKGYSHPRKPHGPGGNTKRRKIGTRESRGLPPRIYPNRRTARERQDKRNAAQRARRAAAKKK